MPLLIAVMESNILYFGRQVGSAAEGTIDVFRGGKAPPPQNANVR